MFFWVNFTGLGAAVVFLMVINHRDILCERSKNFAGTAPDSESEAPNSLKKQMIDDGHTFFNIHIYIYIHIYIDTYTYIYIYMCVYIHVYIPPFGDRHLPSSCFNSLVFVQMSGVEAINPLWCTDSGAQHRRISQLFQRKKLEILRVFWGRYPLVN